VGGGQSVLIDEKGRAWEDGGWELARRIGYSHPTLDLASFAVRERGFIHLRPQDGGVRVALRAGGFGLETLAGALFLLKDRNPERILLAIFDGTGWQYEMLANVWEFGERTERLAQGEAVRPRHLWLAAERNLKSLSLPGFSPVRPVLRVWQAHHGRLPDELRCGIANHPLSQRMILVRQRQGTSRLVFEHFGAGIEFMDDAAREHLVGRDIADLPDRGYGAWVARAYEECLAGRRLRLESIRATIRSSETTTVSGRYDRLLMPWSDSRDNLFVMAISLRRELSYVA
jgi:hypothetical protein